MVQSALSLSRLGFAAFRVSWTPLAARTGAAPAEKAWWLRETAVMEARIGASFTVVMVRDASPFFSHDKAVRRLLHGGFTGAGMNEDVSIVTGKLAVVAAGASMEGDLWCGGSFAAAALKMMERKWRCCT